MSGMGVISEPTAQRIFSVLARQSAELNSLVAELQQTIVDQQDSVEARRFIGNMIGVIYDEGLRPIFKAHPSLIPEELRK